MATLCNGHIGDGVGRSGDQRQRLVLTVIACEGAEGNITGLLQVVEGWLAERGAILETRRRAPELAQGMVTATDAAGLCGSLRAIRDTWLDEYRCDVNLCSAALAEWYNGGQPGECLFIFDVDSTLIQLEAIDELARRAGVYDQVAAITRDAMEGRIDFGEAFRRRMALLKGFPAASTFDSIIRSIVYTPGVAELAAALKQRGCRLAMASGGFLPIVEHIRQALGFDYCFANVASAIDGKFTGDVEGDIVDGRRKAAILGELAAKHGIPRERIVAVGDGANDVQMLAEAGIGVAFCAKPVLRKSVAM